MRIGKYTDSMMIANADGRFPARATATPRIGHCGIAPSTTLDRRAFAQGIVLGAFIQGAGAVVILWRTYRNHGGEPVDAVREARDRGQVFSRGPYRHISASANRHRAHRLLGMAVAQQPLRGGPVHRRSVSIHDVLPRNRHQPVADDRAVQLHPTGGRILGVDPGLPPRGHSVPAADHPMYTGWSYWVFRGKVRGDLGYH
jgi:hypothetical protein